jgi:hypothetical protein
VSWLDQAERVDVSCTEDALGWLFKVRARGSGRNQSERILCGRN